ncbi:MAG: hypothetical protein RMK43_12805, partial [Cyclobacteriaceae bacterium]|nr:hypothetical protein [Cyclobacteriaceae bacterium]
LIAGYEIGGQMQLLAETFRKRGVQATAVSYNDDFRGYQNDVMLSGRGWKMDINRFFFFLWALNHYHVFHFFWGYSLWNWWKFHLLDLPVLKLFRKKIIVHFRGLDVIDIRYFDYLRDKNRGLKVSAPPLNRPDQRKKLKKWLRYADEVLVSEPDLFAVVPDAILSPQVIDIRYWTSTQNPLSEKDGVIRIVHAPSSRRKKGTDFIEEAIKNLQDKGYPVQLILAENQPHHKIRELYEISDIGIDQVLYGWHGKVSVELMALEKPVICNINSEWKKYRPELPVIHADPSNLVSVLELLITDPDKRKQLGKSGREYVLKYHDVECVANELLDLYGIDINSGTRSLKE